MADEVIRFNGFPFLEKEDKETDHDASFEPSEYQPSSQCGADSSCARHEEGSDLHESIGYAFAGDQYVSQIMILSFTHK